MLRYALFWLVMPFLGIANGAFREFVIIKFVDAKAANQLSVATLIMLLLTYGVLISAKLPLNTKYDALLCGVLWILLTVIFEFTFGYYGANKSMNELLLNYNFLKGNLWTLVLVFLGVLPFILLERKA